MNLPSSRDRSENLFWHRMYGFIFRAAYGKLEVTPTKIPIASTVSIQSQIHGVLKSLLLTKRIHPLLWVYNNSLFCAGGGTSGTYLTSIEKYDPVNESWNFFGSIPENKYSGDASVLDHKVYILAGKTSSNSYSNKVFAADLNASVEAHDLYVKTGDASSDSPSVQAEVADGSIGLAQLSSEVTDKLNQTFRLMRGRSLWINYPSRYGMILTARLPVTGCPPMCCRTSTAPSPNPACRRKY